MNRVNTGTLTPQQRVQLAHIRQRTAQRKLAQESEKVEKPIPSEKAKSEKPAPSEKAKSEKPFPPKSEDDEKKSEQAEKEARRRAARRRMARKVAQAQDEAKKSEQSEKGEAKSEQAEKEARLRAARRRAQRYAMRRRAQEKTISDDLVKPDEGVGDSSQKPQPETASGQKAIENQKEDANQDTAAEDKVLAAYNLIDAQVAHGVVSPDVRKASLANSYVKAHSVGEMKFAAEQLGKVGAAGKTAGNVRVARRASSFASRTASRGNDELSDSLSFY